MKERGETPALQQRRWATAAFCVWLCVVWGHSLMAGEMSSFESSRFVFLVRPFFALFGNNDEALMTFVIRKTAHFSEYAILAALACNMAVAWFGESRRAWLLTIAIWLAAPCVDECIQLFVPDRAGMMTDVLLDMSGGLFGLALFFMVRKLRHDAEKKD